MAIEGHRLFEGASGWIARLLRARLILGAAAMVLFALQAMGVLSLIHALVGFAIVVIAASINVENLGDLAVEAASHEGKPLAADWLIETVISGLPDMVIALDKAGIVVASNPAARAQTPALTRGAPLWLAFRSPAILEAVRRATTTGRGERVEFSERVPEDRWWEAVIVPVVLPESVAGRRDLIIVTIHDLSPLRRIEDMRADFVANASHELRTPLASLSGFIETLQGSAKDDAQARERFLAIMKTQANRMARLIDDLLSLSRIEMKANIQPEQQVDLVATVRQVADGLQTLARDRGVAIHIDAPDQLAVRGDRDEIVRVFENLIENALKYGASGARVDITLAADPAANGGEAVASVRDYGPGIAPEHLPRLTERFYRVDVADSRAQGGTGLGLALVKHIVNRHRGRFAIASELGHGATFTVRLPLFGEIAQEPKIMT